MCLAFFIESHGFDSQPGATQEGSPGRKCPGGELLECYSKEYDVEGSIVAVWRALQACEDEPVRPRVSVLSEGFVLEGHESDPKVVLYQRLHGLTTHLYPGPVQKGLGHAPRASGACAQLAVI